MIQTWFPPHVRLIAVFVLSLLISHLQFAIFLLFLTACTAFWLIFLHLKQRRSLILLLEKWLKFNLFTLLIWLMLSWEIGTSGMQWSAQGIVLAELITLRMNLILLLTWSLLWAVTDTVLVQALAKLPLPRKLIQLFVLTVRYIALLGELNQKMEVAMKARSFQPKCNHYTLNVYAQRVALLLIHALTRAEHANIALKARGFKI